MRMPAALYSLALVVGMVARVGAQSLPPVESVGGVSLPTVPTSVAAAGVEAAQAARAATPENAPADTAEAQTASTLSVAPGVTELVKIARGYLNRITTPFSDPKLLTVNPIEVRKEGGSIYLSTNSEKPVGVHILSNDPDDTRSISLTLIPARIPPRTLELRWQEETSTIHRPSSYARAKRWEQSSPYVEKLLELAELIARGEIPAGYSLGKSDADEVSPCHLSEVNFAKGQRLTGAHFSVLVLKATNTGTTSIDLTGNAGCHAPGVALVAAWPYARLASKASTELYVVVRNNLDEALAAGQARPSLLEAHP